MSTTTFISRLPVRTLDKWGSGLYGASRGSRIHKGVDLAAYPGTGICSATPGRVSKIGWPYYDNPDTEFDESSFRYVQVSWDNYDYRYFYILPTHSLQVGHWVHTGEALGILQDLTKKYPGITNHLHFSIKKDGVYVNPDDFLEDTGNDLGPDDSDIEFGGTTAWWRP